MTNKKSTSSTRTAKSKSADTKAKSSTTTTKPAAKRCSVTFTMFAPNAQSVDVAGSFNDWKLKPLKKGRDGTWKAIMRPKPGRYEYKFVVDDQWITDPSNPELAHDEYGNVNSVIELS